MKSNERRKRLENQPVATYMLNINGAINNVISIHYYITFRYLLRIDMGAMTSKTVKKHQKMVDSTGMQPLWPHD